MKLDIQLFGGRGASSSQRDYRNTYSAKEISSFSNNRLSDEIKGTTKEYEKAVNTRNIFDGRTYNGRMERTYNKAQVSKLSNKMELLEKERATRVRQINKVLKMNRKELNEYDRGRSYKNSDVANYVRAKTLYWETGLQRHEKEYKMYEKRMRKLLK